MAEDPPSYIDDTHQRFCEFADEFLDEDEREEFVNQLLERHGYEQNTVTTWTPPNPAARRGGAAGGGGGRQSLVKPRSGQGQGGGQRRGSYFGGRQAGR